MTLEYRIGDVFDRLAEIPDGSIDLVVTSPPFLALRSYLPADHPDKHKEIGSEPTPAEFLDTLYALSAEWGRVLAPHGSICVELGDTYSGSGGGGGDYLPGGLREDQPGFGGSAERQREGNAAHWRAKNQNRAAWPLAKSLTGIPTLYPWGLAYGRNLLTGQPHDAGQWRIRNVIVWARPNPPVGALGDKFRPATSYITVACKGQRRYFDLDAVRQPVAHPDAKASHRSGKRDEIDGQGSTLRLGDYDGSMSAGAPPLDWHADDHPEDGDWLWKLSTQPYKGSHYATFPLTLPRRLIEAMCPLRVCTAVVCKHCGHKHESITERDIHDVEMGRGEVPEPGSVQAELRRVRDLLREQESVHLLSELRPEASTGDVAIQRPDAEHGDSGQDQPPGVHQAVQAGVSGSDDEGVRPGASLRDAGAPGSDSEHTRARSSQERDSQRQPARESRSGDEGDTPRRGQLPGLRSALLDSLTCDSCGRTGFTVCGKPSERIVGEAEYIHTDGRGRTAPLPEWKWGGDAVGKSRQGSGDPGNMTRSAPTLGWTDCGHGSYRVGVVLDPFAGSGTTLEAAQAVGRHGIGIDLDERNADLARERVGMFLEVAS